MNVATSAAPAVAQSFTTIVKNIHSLQAVTALDFFLGLFLAINRNRFIYVG